MIPSTVTGLKNILMRLSCYYRYQTQITERVGQVVRAVSWHVYKNRDSLLPSKRATANHARPTIGALLSEAV